MILVDRISGLEVVMLGSTKATSKNLLVDCFRVKRINDTHFSSGVSSRCGGGAKVPRSGNSTAIVSIAIFALFTIT